MSRCDVRRSSARRRGFVSVVSMALVGAVVALVPAQAGAAVAVDTPRVAGVDRYATSAELSEATFPDGADVAVVASGQSFADGLAASALAGHVDGPVLLVPPAGPLPSSVKAELNRLGASTVRIVGGHAAVSQAVEDELASRDLEVIRSGGSDRYDTARLVASRVGTGSIGDFDGLRTAFVATGMNFPDALAASAPAFSGEHPILLTPTSELSPAAESALEVLGIEQVIIMGGTGAVSSAVERAIERTGDVENVIRVAGADRGATARELADLLVTAAPDGFGYGTTAAVITSGVAFPDALAAGPFAGTNEAPILFASPTTTAAEDFLEDHRSTVGLLTIVGGTAAVTHTQVDRLEDAATQPSNQTFLVLPALAQTLSSAAYSASNPDTYVEYTASGIPSDVSSVSIALADPAKVLTSSSTGTITFTKASGTPTRADLTNTRVGDLKIRAVNGSAPSGGAATSLSNVSVSGGRVTFRVGVSGVNGLGTAVPVVYEASGGNLLVSTSGAPSGDFAIGGRVDAVPAEAPVGTSGSTTVWSIGGSFIGATSSSFGWTFEDRVGDDYRIAGVGGTSSTNRSAFLAALSVGDTVFVTYNQQEDHSGAFVANVFNLTDDVVAAPTGLSASTRDADSNGSVDTVRLTFNAPRTGLQTSSAITVRRFTVTNGVVGTTPTDVVTSWTYTSGTSGQVDLTNANFPLVGSYQYQVAIKGVTGSSFSPFSSNSGTVTISSTGLDTVPSAPIATEITVNDSSPTGLDPGDTITVTFNEPMQLTSGTRSIELQDSGGDRASLTSTTPNNATFTVGGVDSNVLTISVTGAPTLTNGAGPVNFGATTVIYALSSTFKDRDATPQAWNPTSTNTLGAGGAVLGVSTVPGSNPVVPFTPVATGGKITLNHVSNVITGAAGAAVPGAVVFVSAVGGTGGTAADAVTATRKQATASATGAFSIALTSATEATTVQVKQEVQRTALTVLTSAASASIAAQPAITAASTLTGGDGDIENGDEIEFTFSAAMSTTGLASFDVSVSNATPNVITIKKASTSDVVATITTTGVRYNTHATDAMTFLTSAGVWSSGNTVLTITLANQTGGTPANVASAHTSSWVAGPALVDTNGVAIDTTAVTGASSRF